MQSAFTAVQVPARELFRRTFEFSEAHCHSSVAISSTETAAISPGNVEGIIRGPGDRPQIAAGSRGSQRVPVPGDRFNVWAARIRGAELRFRSRGGNYTGRER